MSIPANSPIRAQLNRLVDRAYGKQAGPEPCLHTVPLEHYSSQNHFEQEWKAFYSDRPVVLCHASQLAEPGSTLVHDWLGLPLLTVCDASGAIRTFMNVCRHRNMRLVPEQGQQSLRSLVCPYHQWTYGLNGELRNIPRQEDFADINKAELGLIELPTEVRNGLVWLQLSSAQAMDLDAHLITDGQDIGSDLDEFGIGTAKLFAQNTRTISANWKLVHDAFLDGYHVVRLHKNTVGPFFPDCVAESEQLGLHTRSAVGRNEIMESADIPSEDRDPRLLCTFSYTLFPNVIVIMHPDYTSLVSLFPQGPDSTIFSHSLLLDELPTTEKATQHFNKSFELIDQGVMQAEDIFVCEGAQKGMLSGANQAMTFGANELSIMSFHSALADELKRRT